MAIKVRATVRQMYAGRAMLAGDEFEVDSQQDADDLVAVRIAQIVTPGDDDAPQKRAYRRRDLKAQE